MAYARMFATRVPQLIAKTRPLPTGGDVSATAVKTGDGGPFRISEQPRLSNILGVSTSWT